MRVVFAGTPAFAVPSLAALVASTVAVAGVLTQPDRPAGRGRRPRASAVKLEALRHGLEVRQPDRLAAELDWLAAIAPDVLVVVAYGLLLPPSVLALPRRGCVNVHASLLPRWRGAAPIARAIEAGDDTTGVTLMQMDEGLDTGDVLCARAVPVHPRDTSGSLHDRLAETGAELLASRLDDVVAGRVRATPQDAALATTAAKLRKEEAVIDWAEPADDIERRIRAFNPWPVCHGCLRGKRLRIWEACTHPAPTAAAPGTIHRIGSRLVVSTGDGGLELLRVQRDGHRALSTAEFLNGTAVRSGAAFDAV